LKEEGNDRNGESNMMRSLFLPASLLLVTVVMVAISFFNGNSVGSNGIIMSSSFSSSSSLAIVNDKDVMDIGIAKYIPTGPVCIGKINTIALGLVTCPNLNDETIYNGNVPNEFCKQTICEGRGGTYDNSESECFGSPSNRFCRTNLKCCDIPHIDGRTQPVCKGKTDTAAFGVETCPNTDDDFTMYGKYPKEICQQKSCEVDHGGKYDNSDFICDPHPRIGSTGCITNIKCCNIPTPDPVPSLADKNRYGISYCGKLDGPDGPGYDTITVQDAIYNTKKNNGRPIVYTAHFQQGRLHQKSGQTLTGGSYLWGGSCRGKCVKRSGTGTCTY